MRQLKYHHQHHTHTHRQFGLNPSTNLGPNPSSPKLGLDLCTKSGPDPSTHTQVLVLILAQRLVLIPRQSQVWSQSDGTRHFTNQRDIFKVAKAVHVSQSDAQPCILLLQLNRQTPTSLPCLEHTHTHTYVHSLSARLEAGTGRKAFCLWFFWELVKQNNSWYVWPIADLFSGIYWS